MDQKDAGPPTVVDDFGRFRFGTYTTPIFNPDFKTADLSDVPKFIGGANRRGLGGWLRAMRMKEWHFISLTTEEYYLAAAVAQLGYVGNAFCFIVEKDTGTRHEFERITPFGKSITFADSSVRGTTSWREGNDYMTFDYQPQAGGLWSCTFNLPCSGKDRLKGQVSIYPEPECCALVYPLDSNRAAYTHKEAGNRVEGLLTLGVQELRFEHDAQATLDWTRSYPDRHTRWNWLSVAGISGDGRRVGLNLSEHIYGGAENFMWLEGMPHPLGLVEFTPPTQQGLPWRIASDRVMLEFQPEGARAQSVNYQFVKSKFLQHYGVIEGHVRFGGGLMQVNGLFGVCEEHDATW